MDVDAAPPVEGRDPPVLLEPVAVGGHLDEADRLEPGRQARLGLEPRVQVAGVGAHRRRGLRRRPEGDDQPRRVPGRARGQLVALQQQDVGPAFAGQVVGDGAADDATSHDHDAGAIGQDRIRHGGQVRGQPAGSRPMAS